jgi:hypothetical protein
MRSRLTLLTAGLVAATCVAATGPASAHVTPRPSANACSSTVSIKGFSDALDKTSFGGTYFGNLSALALDGRSRLLTVSDRSALFTMDARDLRPTAVAALADENGAGLDAEGLAVDRDGTLLVSSELEPSVRRYKKDGTLLGSLPVPDALKVAPAGRAVRNRTFEGLTLYPGGKRLLAAMEYAISGDSPDIVRLQTWQRHGSKGFRLGAQFGYRADAGLGVPEVAGLLDGRLLVLERGFTAGVGNTVRLYLADPRWATDTSGVENLTGQPGVRLVPKKLLADLGNCPSLGAVAKQPQPNPLLDNIEGMVVTGRSSGRLDLLLVSDDNENPTQITRFYRLSVDPTPPLSVPPLLPSRSDSLPHGGPPHALAPAQ